MLPPPRDADFRFFVPYVLFAQLRTQEDLVDHYLTPRSTAGRGTLVLATMESGHPGRSRDNSKTSAGMLANRPRRETINKFKKLAYHTNTMRSAQSLLNVSCHD